MTASSDFNLAASGPGHPFQQSAQTGSSAAAAASNVVFGAENQALNNSMQPPTSSLTAAATSVPAAGSGGNLVVPPAAQARQTAAGANTSQLANNDSSPSFFTKIRSECKEFCTALGTSLKEESSKPGFWKKVAAAILGAVAFPFAFAMKAYQAAGEVLDTHRVSGFTKTALKVSAGIAGFVGAMLLAVIPKVGFVAGMGGGAIIGYQYMARRIEAELEALKKKSLLNPANKV